MAQFLEAREQWRDVSQLEFDAFFRDWAGK